MLSNTPIKNVMTSDVVTAIPTASMMTVGDIFDANNFHHLPIVDEDEQLVGMLSQHDYNKMLTTFSIFKNSRAEVANRRYKMALLAKDVMTDQVAKVHPDDTVGVAVGIFKENLFHALPVVDDENKVVGIITTFDLLNFAFDEKNLLGMPTPSASESRRMDEEELEEESQES